MRRLAVLTSLVAFVLMVPLSHWVLSDPPKDAGGEKVLLCHVPGDNQIKGFYEGNIIEVSENALEAHCSKHNDCTNFKLGDKEGDSCLCPIGKDPKKGGAACGNKPKPK
jgi:hypothetical protein